MGGGDSTPVTPSDGEELLQRTTAARLGDEAIVHHGLGGPRSLLDLLFTIVINI
jgi:hypothetical protein